MGARLDGRRKPAPVLNQAWLRAKARIIGIDLRAVRVVAVTAEGKRRNEVVFPVSLATCTRRCGPKWSRWIRLWERVSASRAWKRS
jgi:hypothetical protein